MSISLPHKRGDYSHLTTEHSRAAQKTEKSRLSTECLHRCEGMAFSAVKNKAPDTRVFRNMANSPDTTVWAPPACTYQLLAPV
jgi:hypothetical protein